MEKSALTVMRQGACNLADCCGATSCATVGAELAQMEGTISKPRQTARKSPARLSPGYEPRRSKAPAMEVKLAMIRVSGVACSRSRDGNAAKRKGRSGKSPGDGIREEAR